MFGLAKSLYGQDCPLNLASNLDCSLNLYALHTLLMMTAELMLSKRPVLRFTAALFFLLEQKFDFYV